MSVDRGMGSERLYWIDGFLAGHLESDSGNFVDSSDAIVPEMESLKMFERVSVGVAGADDPYFELCREKAVGKHFRMPDDWLPGARSIVSFFFSFTKRVVDSNFEKDLPSPEWLHARIEGQKYINSAMSFLKEKIENSGYAVVVPSIDPRLSMTGESGERFTSSWSERHVAYACGLGTFGLSKGLITKSGAAGRLASMVTTLDIPPSGRGYTGLYDYCSMCGACAKRCPAGAIDIQTGKDHEKCSVFLDRMLEKFSPRYGCGKCQTGVPCQDGVPSR